MGSEGVNMDLSLRFRGCLLGGAIGDALGYPVEFQSLREIRNDYGEKGISNLMYDPVTRVARISDDTQMTLFTANGLLLWRGLQEARSAGFTDEQEPSVVQSIYMAYQRWYYTQSGHIHSKELAKPALGEDSHDFILDQEELFHRRAPGNTCLSALQAGMGTPEHPLNHSKGCGGVMRVAPIGLFYYTDPVRAFDIGCKAAAITHGHVTGYLTAGAFAMLIAYLVQGETLNDALDRSVAELMKHIDYEETVAALNMARKLAISLVNPEKAISQLGEGWIAEEALAIAVYCALVGADFEESLKLAVNHNGDSDSTGAICGNLVGCMLGVDAIPIEWLKHIELANYTNRLATDLM